jgi:signal transduction histidine kinase
MAENGNTQNDLLAVIQQAAIGLIVADKSGSIKHMNSMAEQMVMPLFMQTQLKPDNIVNLLEMIASGIAEKITNFPNESGYIITQQKQTVELEHEGQVMVRHFFYSINKVSEESVVFSFDDITNYHEAQEELGRVNQEMAIDKSKFEMAAGVLHDIGNAVVGIGSHLGRAKKLVNESDVSTLVKLEKFLKAHESKLGESIGSPKANALIDLVQGLVADQNNLLNGLETTIREQMGITSHISDILNIQRQYISTGEARPREAVNLRGVIYDALAILLASIEKREIRIISDLPENISSFIGDRTKLIQVVLNLIKNAIDAIDNNPEGIKELHLKLKETESEIQLEVIDSGEGFDSLTEEKIFERGFTTKTQGMGLGLASAKMVAETHNGDLTLKSEGKGKGATAVLSIGKMDS